jgi:hypothetical protein
MGLDTNGTRLLLHARKLGVDFSRTAMLGRQSLYTPPKVLDAQLAEYGLASSNSAAEENPEFADDFLRQLGAGTLDAFDASDYEHADHTHDFNEPIDPCHHQQYTTVLDGGSLEHVFNFPIAIRNCMEMIAEGGHFLGITPANNFFGHGFYQFSPELYFQIFQAGNGFRIQQMLLFEDLPGAPWFEVSNPQDLRRRVTLVNQRPAYLFVIAQRTAIQPIFQSPPQQSDYVATWEANSESPTDAPVSPTSPKPEKRFLDPLRKIISNWKTRRFRKRTHSLSNREFFKPLD